MLKELTMADGVSGDEKPVRDFIIDQIRDRVDSWHVDNMGNLIAFKKGTDNELDVELTADPYPTWKKLEEMVDKGKVRNIGISKYVRPIILFLRSY